MPRARLPVLDHLIAMTDDVGLFQHARVDVPARAHGYCTDDIARALIVACRAAQYAETEAPAVRLASTYLSFLVDAQLEDGWFHGFMGYDRRWQDRRGTGDAFGRAVWSLGYAAVHAPRPSWRHVALGMLRAALPNVTMLKPLRSVAYAALGLAAVVGADPSDSPAAAALSSTGRTIAAAFRSTARADWQWCESTMTYDNARLCEALLRAGIVLRDRDLVRAGCAMLDFYAGIVIEDGAFVPIGSDGWYAHGGRRARYAQQPLEAAACIDAGLAALEATGDERFRSLAQLGYDWYFGRNSLGALMICNGGCRDGLDAGGVNANMGAESTLAYLMSAYAMLGAQRREQPALRRIAVPVSPRGAGIGPRVSLPHRR